MAKKIIITAIGATMLLTACDVKDPIYNTAHPNHGKITLTTNWSNIGSGITVPQNYTIKAGDYSATLSGTTNTIEQLFAPGGYSLYVYNSADNITVSGTTFTVATAATPDYGTGTFINPLPGWLFTCAMNATVEADTDHNFTAVMRQQVRELTLVIEPTGSTDDRIESIAATFLGMAGSYDMASDAHGTVSSISLTFAKDTDGKWKTIVYLLGVTGSEQKLTGTITFAGGTPADMSIESDLTEELAAFNENKKEPLTLGGQVVETPTETGFTGKITDWVKISGSGIAN